MHFEKVSYIRFLIDVNNLYNKQISSDNEILAMYNKIKLPRRSTERSAGYDFVIPYSIDIYKGSSIVIPTGIRAVDMPSNVVLLMAPRSGLGFRYRVSLANTIGVIDSDYADSSNSGHILIKICYDGFNYDTKIDDNSLIDYENSVLSVSTSKVDLENATDTPLHLSAGDRFCQGIFTYCLFVDNDECKNIRDGGFGSTGNT